MKRKIFSDYDVLSDVDREDFDLTANSIGKTILSKVQMPNMGGDDSDSEKSSGGGGGEGGGGKGGKKDGEGKGNGGKSDKEQSGNENKDKDKKDQVHNKEEKLKELENEISKLEELIKSLKESGVDSSGIEKLLDDLKKAKEKIENSEEADSSKVEDKGTKKKKYNPDINDGAGIDQMAFNNNMEEQSVSGQPSSMSSILSQLVNDNATIVSAYIEYILNVVVKKGLQMESMFNSLDRTPESIKKPAPSVSHRDKSPAQAARIEKIRAGSSDSRVIMPVVRTKEDVPFAVKNVKSIFISIDDSGSMHSYLNSALSYSARDISSNPIIKEFNKSYEKYQGDVIVKKILDRTIEESELKDFIQKMSDDINKVMDNDNNNFLSILIAGIIGSLRSLSESFDNFSGLIYASQSPFKCLAGAPVLKKSSGGNYLYFDFARYYESSNTDIYKKNIEKFITTVNGGNESSYDVGLAWGKMICNMILLSTAAHLYSNNFFIEKDNNNKNYIYSKLRNISPLRYNWAIGIFHFTDLYYDIKNGFLKGFYDGIKRFKKDDIKLYHTFYGLSETIKDLGVFSIPAESTLEKENYLEESRDLFDQHLGLFDFNNIINLIISLRDNLKFEYKDGLFKVDYIDKNLSSVRIILPDIAIFSFGHESNSDVYFKSELSNFKNLTPIRDTYSSVDSFRSVMDSVGPSGVFPSRLSLYNENAITFLKVMLSIKVAMISMFNRELESMGDISYMNDAEKSDLFISIANSVKSKILDSYDTISNIMDRTIFYSRLKSAMLISNTLENNSSALNDILSSSDINESLDLFGSYYVTSKKVNLESGNRGYNIRVPSFII